MDSKFLLPTKVIYLILSLIKAFGGEVMVRCSGGENGGLILDHIPAGGKDGVKRQMGIHFDAA